MAFASSRLSLSLVAAPVLLSLLVPLPAGADEITDQLDVAREAYEAGNLSQTVDELNYAIAQIQEQINASNVKLLPEPLEGWTAGEATSASGGLAALGGGTTMARSYSSSDGGTIEIQVIANSPLIQGMSMMLSNPMLMQMDPSTKPYRYKGSKGMIKHDAGSTDYQVSLMVSNSIMVQVEGSGLASKEPVIAYLKAMDLKAIKAAFAG